MLLHFTQEERNSVCQGGINCLSQNSLRPFAADGDTMYEIFNDTFAGI